MLRTACREAATWQQPLTIAVNVSARQIHSELFATTLHNILFETKLPPQNLELEITESTLIRDLARALSTLRLVKALGVRIARGGGHEPPGLVRDGAATVGDDQLE